MGAGCVETAVRSPYVKETVHEGWEVIFQNHFPVQPKTGKHQAFPLHVVRALMGSFFCVSTSPQRAAFSPPPLLPGGIPHHISDRLGFFRSELQILLKGNFGGSSVWDCLGLMKGAPLVLNIEYLPSNHTYPHSHFKYAAPASASPGIWNVSSDWLKPSCAES